MKTLLFLTFILLFSCNNPVGHIQQQVDRNIESSIQDMDTEVQKLKQDFIAIYADRLRNQVDSSDSRKLQDLYISVVATDIYLDSLKGEMDRLDKMDISNVEEVKAIFLYKGAGDSIIRKFKISLAAAQNFASTERGKVDIKAATDTLFDVSDDKWKEQLFGLTNPVGARMILNGLQSELYNIGMKALSER